jgi:phage-related protein
MQGMARTIKGVVDLISGIMHGDFRKAFSGIKEIVSGAIKGALGSLRASTAPFREAVSRIGDQLGKLASKFFRAGWDIAKSILNGIVGGIKTGAKAVGHAITSTLSSVASAVNPFGDGIGRSVQATIDNTSALRDVSTELARQNAISESTIGVELATVYRALADTMSGQLGYKTQGKALLSGSGALARY